MNELAPWEGHRERLRQRAVSEGFDALHDYQIIELLLCYVVPRADVSELAKALVSRFGSATDVLASPREALLEFAGMTGPMAEWLVMTGELLSAYERVDPLSLFRIWRFRDLMDLLAPVWRGVPAPQSWMIFTDYEGRILMRMEICQSLHWADAQHAMEMVQAALSVQARSAFLLLFNGVEPPELADWEQDYLLALSRTLRAIGVELMDCVMVGEAGMVSLNAQGRMAQIERESTRMELHENYRRQGYAEGNRE